MNRELAAYLFFDVPLYKNPISNEGNPLEMSKLLIETRREEKSSVQTDSEAQTPFTIPKTSKKHAWFLGEKPVGEKKELLVKLLAAIQLKGSDVAFYFERHPVFPFIEATPHVETVFVFGQETVFGELMQSLNQPQLIRNTSLILSNTLEQLVSNTTSEKRNLWAVLKKVYLESSE